MLALLLSLQVKTCQSTEILLANCFVNLAGSERIKTEGYLGHSVLPNVPSETKRKISPEYPPPIQFSAQAAFLSSSCMQKLIQAYRYYVSLQGGTASTFHLGDIAPVAYPVIDVIQTIYFSNRSWSMGLKLDE